MFPQTLMQPIGQLSTQQLMPLGAVVYDPKDQGRTAYRYVQFGGTATINPGLLLVSAAAPSNSTGLALPTSNTAAQLAAGSTQGSIIVTNGATTVNANQFQDGDLEILGSGAIERYRILGNSQDATGSLPLAVRFDGPLRNTAALVAGTNTVNLRQSPSLNPVASLTAALPIGVTIMPVPNTAAITYFGWVQIAGMAFVQATSATKGQPLVQDTAGTAGYLMNNAASTTSVVAIAKESQSGSLVSALLQIN